MVPVNVWGIVFFLVLIAPGLLDDLLFESRAVRGAESTFREISRVVLASLAFSAVPLLLLTIVGDRGLASFLPDPSSWTHSGEQYAVENYGQIVFALVLQTTLSCGLVVLWHRIRRKDENVLTHKPAWVKVFRDENTSGEPPELRVKLNNGSVIWGTLADYTMSFDIDDRELVLAPPLFVRRAGGSRQPMGARMHRVVLRATNIESIAVTYVETTAGRRNR